MGLCVKPLPKVGLVDEGQRYCVTHLLVLVLVGRRLIRVMFVEKTEADRMGDSSTLDYPKRKKGSAPPCVCFFFSPKKTVGKMVH